jgi:hypothetical protein
VIRTKVLSLLLLIVSLAVPPAFAAPHPGAAARKIDSGLARALNTGARTQQVIVTVKDGYRAQVRAALETHGDTVRSELPLIGGLAASAADRRERRARRRRPLRRRRR